MTTLDPHQIKQDAEVLYSEQVVLNAIASIAARLNIDYQGEYPMVLSVMNGAVFFVGQLTPQLTFPLILDYVHATRYQNGVEGKEVNWVARPKNTIKGANVLILDDILDEGHTLKAIVDTCYALGAKQVKVAVLVEKDLDKAKPLTADYVGIKVPNRYIFGCGMDIHGWWRNLPAIYALKQP
ncbi:MAG: hypoxanthine-guanine phosphoribosyltransferase [Methylophilaceae bacterium]|jgi:hypoxanthine phosphoribosyltransferase|nr:MAG: hypoxanthine-guanine phosphoribosyltransferase [Methylophilaceae bacterium]